MESGDNYQCYICGDTRKHIAEEHHAVPRRYLGSDDGENVYILCANCHSAVESIYDEGFYNRLMDKLGIEGSARDRIHAENDVEGELGEDRWITDEAAQLQACKAVYDEALECGIDDGWVPVEIASDRIRRYLPNPEPVRSSAKMWGNLLEHIPESQMSRKDRNGTAHLRCTEDAQKRIFASGSSTLAGNGKHRLLLRDAYRELTKVGFTVEIPYQGEEKRKMPDAYATLGAVDMLQYDPEETDARGVVDIVEEFEKTYPLLARLSNAREVAIEAECETVKTKPARTLGNLAKARESGKRCLFVCRKDTAPAIWTLLAEKPRFMSRTAEKRIHRVYNFSRDLKIDGERVYIPKPQGNVIWTYSEMSDTYELTADGEVYASLMDASDVHTDASCYPASESEIGSIKEERWTSVKMPAVPEEVFGGELPIQEEWDILVIEDSGMSVYDEGEYVPVDELLEHKQRFPNSTSESEVKRDVSKRQRR